MKKIDKKKIVIGMSSGVDSSTSAAILKKQGWDVTGVFLLMFDDAKKDIEDTKKVCEKIGITLKIVDVRKEFRDKVIKYFLREYASGKTPNPCVYCNENLKFKFLFEQMKKEKADYIASGHYARTRKSKGEDKYELFEAKDKNKDQSYFLYRLKQSQLKNIIFPLGDFEKTEVRRLARDFGLPVSEKKESQDVCFLKDVKIEEFLRKNLKLKKGKILNENREVIGQHKGVEIYTIGQRKGISVGGDGPFYVLKKDKKNNTLIVSNDKKSEILYKKEINLKNVNWLSKKPKFPIKTLIRTRFRNPLIYATIREYNRAQYKIELEKPQFAVTSGQSVVFYQKNGKVIGGGIIK